MVAILFGRTKATRFVPPPVDQASHGLFDSSVASTAWARAERAMWSSRLSGSTTCSPPPLQGWERQQGRGRRSRPTTCSPPPLQGWERQQGRGRRSRPRPDPYPDADTEGWSSSSPAQGAEGSGTHHADMRRPDADMRRDADPTTDGTDRGEGGDRSKGRVPGDPGVGVEVRHPRSGARPAGRWSGSGSTGLGPVPQER